MKVRTTYELSVQISNISTWRKHELKNLQSFFKTTQKVPRALGKGALLLAYAHWEGGVKDMAATYLHHVEQQKCLRKDLQVSFLALASIGAIKAAAESNTILPYLQAVDYIISSHEHRYQLPNIKLVDTESNLSSKVLRNILACIGLTLEWRQFEAKQRIIDTALLATRNDIAHTGSSTREKLSLDDLIGEVLALLSQFATVIENAAATKAYRADA